MRLWVQVILPLLINKKRGVLKSPNSKTPKNLEIGNGNKLPQNRTKKHELRSNVFVRIKEVKGLEG